MTPGQRKDINSYHSELGGLYRVVSMVKQVVSYHNIDGGVIEVGSNCLVGPQRAFTSQFKFSSSEVHHNLISAIHKKVAQSLLHWRW